MTIELSKDSGVGTKFNLRDRNKITYNKKYGAFVCYKPEDNLDDNEKYQEENKIESSTETPTVPSSGAILRPRKHKDLLEESDDEFQPK